MKRDRARTAEEQRWWISNWRSSMRGFATAQRNLGEFERCFGQFPHLAACRTPVEVLRVLHDTNEQGKKHRDRLSWELVYAFQTYKRPLWTALLVAAYHPLLCGLRSRWKQFDDDEEFDQVVVLQFLEVATKLPLEQVEKCIPLRLKFDTKRALETLVAARTTDLEGRVDVEVEQLCDLRTESDQPGGEAVFCPVPDSVAEVREMARAVFSAEDLDLVELRLRGESLRAHVYRLLPGDDAETEYQRLKRKQSRALSKLPDEWKIWVLAKVAAEPAAETEAAPAAKTEAAEAEVESGGSTKAPTGDDHA